MRLGTSRFVGARLREAREARGLTAISLADLIGVSRLAVSQYEYGPQSPSPETMARITQVLNVPLRFFIEVRPPEQAELGAVFYRSLSTATKGARVRAERRFQWLKDIVAYLRGLVEFTAVNFPDLGLSRDPVNIRDEQIEEAARDLRRAWGIGDGPISNVAWLLENNGAVVARQELGAAKLDAFSEWSETERTPYIVLGADKSSAVRSRHDAAHELAHMILHRFMDDLPQGSFKMIEEQAHRFAGAFLLPAKTFAGDFCPNLDALCSMKITWRVSIQAMIVRAGNLGLIDDDQKTRLFVNLSRRGWRMREPYDDEFEGLAIGFAFDFIDEEDVGGVDVVREVVHDRFNCPRHREHVRRKVFVLGILEKAHARGSFLFHGLTRGRR